MDTYFFNKYDCFKCIKCSTVLIIRSDGANNTRCVKCNYLINALEITDKNRLEASKEYIKYNMIKEEPTIDNELTDIDKNIKNFLSEEKKLVIEEQQLHAKKTAIQQNLQILFQNRIAILNKYDKIVDSKYKKEFITKEEEVNLKRRFNQRNYEPKSPEVKKTIVKTSKK